MGHVQGRDHVICYWLKPGFLGSNPSFATYQLFNWGNSKIICVVDFLMEKGGNCDTYFINM